ncbi:primosomal replication protein [Flocculibacter collagenilyticus]|uniref:primosomal replication protein n=1 Tax=Flocculibacter collagenilyticus TaxID=2744479 RepID=UPI0018F7BD05|nr:primosomal replication protein [Flocculibacter collagenilyticus]
MNTHFSSYHSDNFNIVLQKLAHQLSLIKEQSEYIDKFNDENRSVKEQHIRFDATLFKVRSSKLQDYAIEAAKNFALLEKLYKKGQSEYLTYYINLLDSQISALVQAVKSNEVKLKEIQFDKKARQARYQQKLKRTAQHIMQPSHELYAELNQNHEYERRLMNMLEMREARLKSANGAEADTLKQEVLALHQRLGRCRQAISKVENKIAWVEKRNS